MEYQKEINLNRTFWETILGKEICKFDLEDEPLEYNSFYHSEMNIIENIYQIQFLDNTGWDEYCLPGTFSNFYGFFGKIAVEYFKTRNMMILREPEKTILSNLLPAVFWIPLRVLILDIHNLKKRGQLKGEDSKREYHDYQERFLKNKSHIKFLCERYPEMLRLIKLQILYLVHEIWDILYAVEKDKNVLYQNLFEKKNFSTIDAIKCGISDAHNNGQTVAKVYLDNQEVLIYKPRNLQNDKKFFQIYEQFCEKLNLPLQRTFILERDTYSWEEFVSAHECKEKWEIECYYERMGILLFLCYFLDAEDIHGENIIASGEYPIPVDLETIPGYHVYEIRETAETILNETIKNSVLRVGILPSAIWNKDGNGIILNALNQGKARKTPFKVPVICNGESSDICIEYRQGIIKMTNCLPAWKGETVRPDFCTKFLCMGFYKAYLYFLQNKSSLVQECMQLFQNESRCLFRHTQQYHMFLQSSYYPEFLEATEKRRLFLHVLDRKERYSCLLQYERDSLLQTNIPVFYLQGSSTAVKDGNEAEYHNFLKYQPKDTWAKKIDLLSMKDLERQINFIEYSMEYLSERKYMHRKNEVCCLDSENKNYRERVNKQVGIIADQVCGMAIICGEHDIEFCVPRQTEKGMHQFGASGMYLYDGIAGIAVFLASVIQVGETCSLYEYILGVIRNKLFEYTDKKDIKQAALKPAGIFDGEGSIVFAYILLYRLTGEEQYLNYAKLHAGIVQKIWENEASMDFMSGLAGIAVVFCYLYRETQQREYLDNAVAMGEKIWENCVSLNTGAGWCLIDKTPPLAGLAHGNSGLILAYGTLMEYTNDRKYCERIDKLLAHEDSLIENGNWKDLRHPEGKRYCNNAWCHGAAGILLSRFQLKRVGYSDKYDRVKKDIQYCKKIYLEPEEPDDLCLCHGMGGNYLALCFLEQQGLYLGLEKEREELKERLLSCMEGKLISAREKCNPALMTGLSGIGLALIFSEYNMLRE